MLQDHALMSECVYLITSARLFLCIPLSLLLKVPLILLDLCVVISLKKNWSVLFTAMRKVWAKFGLFGPISISFGSLLWSKKTESAQVASGCTSAETSQSSTYDLKLVQVLFRHGARTPLKSIPDVMEVKLSAFDPPLY